MFLSHFFPSLSPSPKSISMCSGEDKKIKNKNTVPRKLRSEALSLGGQPFIHIDSNQEENISIIPEQAQHLRVHKCSLAQLMQSSTLGVRRAMIISPMV